MPLSDAACKHLQPREKAYKKGDSLGLYLLVKPNGSKLFQMKYKYAGKEKTLSIGPYPEVSLAEAREKRDAARKMLRDEYKDSSLAKQEAKRLAMLSAAQTFEAVAREWHEKYKNGWSDNHARTVLRRLEAHVFPSIGKLPIKEINAPRIALLIQGIEDKGSYDIPRRALQMCRAVFAYAKLQGKIEHNPADIKAKDILAKYTKTHYAAMESKDLPLFLKKLYGNEARLFRQTQLAIELMMLTFVRTGELIGAKWDEFDFEKARWDIPASRMKMKKSHLVPLATQSIEILEELKHLSGHREHVFPSQREPRRHMSNNTILMALRRMGYQGIHTGHGFRALAMSTILEDLEYPYEVVDVQLAHAKKGDVQAAYNRAKFLKERTRMMQDWADYIDGLVKK